MNREVAICRTAQKPFLHYREEDIRHLIHACDESSYLVAPGALSLVFMNEDELADLHERFLNDPTPTDVITFDGDPEMGEAGEICVSVERADREYGKQGLSFSEELTLYIIHGWLHLAGYDDRTTAERKRMRQAEAELMKFLREKQAVPTFELNPA